MVARINTFKQALLQDNSVLWGLWVALASPHVAEICASAGFDWILIDGEHGPNDIPLMALQLAVTERHGAAKIIRLPVGEAWLIKQALDIGAQSLLIPMVDTAEQAAMLASACRYPPEGIRGMGAGLARVSDFGRNRDYAANANAQVCLIVQIESRLAMQNVEAIADVPGVDALLIGPADLAADMGFPGRANEEAVYAAVETILARAKGIKPVGIMTTDPVMIARAKAAGARFIASESDVGLLAKATARHVAQMRGQTPSEAASSY